MHLSTRLFAALAGGTLLAGGGLAAAAPALAAPAPGITAVSTQLSEVDNAFQDVPLTVTAPAGSTVTDVNIQIDVQRDGRTCDVPSRPGGASHAHEMYYTLFSPGGVEVDLINPYTYFEAQSGGVVSIVLDDEAVNDVGGPGPESGTFRPVEPLSAFDGVEAAGDWVLRVGDDSGGDFTCHKGYTLTIDVAEITDPDPDPEPVPSVVVDGGPVDGATVTEAPTYRFYSPQGAQKECRVDAGRWEPCSSPYSVDISGLEDGQHSVSFRAYNDSGVGEAVTRTFVLDAVPDEPDDTTAPTVTITSGPADGATVDAAPSYGFTSSDDDVATYECSTDGSEYTACTSPATADVSEPGGHTFAVRAVDTSGNTGTAVTRTFTLRDVAACDDATAALEAAQAKLDRAKAKVKVAKEKLRAALASGNPDRIEKARERVANAKEKRSAAKAAVADAQADVDDAC